MAYEQKPNSGSLWPNDRKEKETHPDLRGSINVDGVDYWISAWGKVSNNGTDWLSLSVKPKDEQSGGGASRPASAGALSKWARPVGAPAPAPSDRSDAAPAPAASNSDTTEDVPF